MEFNQLSYARGTAQPEVLSQQLEAAWAGYKAYCAVT